MAPSSTPRSKELGKARAMTMILAAQSAEVRLSAPARSLRRPDDDVQLVFDHHQPGRHQRAVHVVNRYVGNLAAVPGVFPDYKAPIVLTGPDGRELATARWGMPSSSKALMDATKKRAAKLEAKGKPVDFKEFLRMEPDSGTTNIRNVKSKHWTRWLGPEHRCVVPFNSFSEFNKAEGGDIWFALDESRPLTCFAGIWINWTSIRKVKEGETTNDLYAFFTTEPNAEVGEGVKEDPAGSVT